MVLKKIKIKVKQTNQKKTDQIRRKGKMLKGVEERKVRTLNLKPNLKPNSTTIIRLLGKSSLLACLFACIMGIQNCI